MPAHTPRTFEVPTALVAAGYSPTVDLDVLDREVEFPGEFGDWAEKVLYSENAKTLQDVCGDMRLLPRGILSSVQLDDESIIIDGLVDSDGRVWDPQFNAWGTPSVDVDVTERSIILEDDEVAYVARALREGADEVWFRPFIPKAFVSAVVAAPPPPQDRLGKKSKVPKEPPVNQQIPAGSAIVAVVDPIDEDAVLEMLAITPGPRVLRRHDGNWFEDPEWVPVLKSIKPPKIVKLNEAQVASIGAQVDRSTDEQDWEPFDQGSREQYQIFTASAGVQVVSSADIAPETPSIVNRSPYLQKLQNEADERALFALVAVAGRELTPKDYAATERLKRYWTVGKGAAKIRWGTPGSWTRCYKHLLKYVGPKVAPGYCTNLGKRLGGHGVATHVLSSADEPIIAANPTGRNGYSSGQTFEQATGGVQRDYTGRFAPESGGGGNAAARRERRRRSKAKSRRDREEKENKKSDSEAKKAQRARDKARRDNERQQLANLSLQISEASAAGNTVRAAELRVRRAELALSFARTAIARTNAQTALNNARASLARARRAASRRRSSQTTTSRPSTGEGDRLNNLLSEFERRKRTGGTSSGPQIRDTGPESLR
jgi:hypothetical protein